MHTYNKTERVLTETLVIEFSKKTGDFASLSIPDIKVLALTYTLEVQANGSEHIRKEPLQVNDKRVWDWDQHRLRKQARLDPPVSSPALLLLDHPSLRK